jgi:predicted DNA-binding transcriptional regulator AlpA
MQEFQFLDLQLMSCEELAKLLRVKTNTIYSYLSYDQLPKEVYRRVGKKPTFIYEEIKKWYLDGAKLSPRGKKGK